MAMFLKVLTMVLVNVNLTTCARILCVFPVPLYSHQSFFQPIWRALSERGHDVTVITPNPLKNSSLSTLREIDISFSNKLIFEDFILEKIMNHEIDILTLSKHFVSISNNMTTAQLKSQGVQELIKNKLERFDVLVLEILIPAWLALARIYNCPIVAISSLGTFGYIRNIMGEIYNPVLNPHINVPFVGQLSFFERLACVGFDLFDHMLTVYELYPKQQKIVEETLNDSHIDLFEIAGNVSLLLTNSLPGFSATAPTIFSVVPLNGLHITRPRAMPEDIQKFLDGARKGAIYLSFGSNVKSYLLSEEKKQIFIDVFKGLPFRVLWKYEDGISELPGNVKAVAWAPQQDVLRHKNMKLFITHGGIASIEEAIRFRVPMLGCPFYGDQFQNTIKISKLNLGSTFDHKSLTRDGLKKAILDLVDNNSIKQNLEEISDLMMDPSESLDKAIWAIEHVIKHKGAKRTLIVCCNFIIDILEFVGML